MGVGFLLKGGRLMGLADAQGSLALHLGLYVETVGSMRGVC